MHNEISQVEIFDMEQNESEAQFVTRLNAKLAQMTYSDRPISFPFYDNKTHRLRMLVNFTSPAFESKPAEQKSTTKTKPKK